VSRRCGGMASAPAPLAVAAAALLWLTAEAAAEEPSGPEAREEAAEVSPEPAVEVPAATALPPRRDGRSSPTHKLTLIDGQQLQGAVISDRDPVVLELISGHRLEIPRSAISEITEASRTTVSEHGQLWFEDPNRTRYLYGPSAMRLRPGEVTFSQKELVLSTGGVGLHDNLSVEFGTIVPAWFAERGANFVLGAKAGSSLGENLHLAAGLQTLLLPGQTLDAGLMGFLFGTGTWGNPDRHLSVSLGRPFALGSGESELGAFILTASGNLRLAKNFALVSENWLLPDGGRDGFLLASGTALRMMGEKIAVDVGLVFLVEQRGLAADIPIPWIDFTYNF
jgi:hypothetical protein